MPPDATPSPSEHPEDSFEQNPPIQGNVNDGKTFISKEQIDNDATCITPEGDDGDTFIGGTGEGDDIEVGEGVEFIDPVFARLRELGITDYPRFKTEYHAARKRGGNEQQEELYLHVLTKLFGSETCAQSILTRIEDTRLKMDDVVFRDASGAVRGIFLFQGELGEKGKGGKGGMGSVKVVHFPEGDAVVKTPLIDERAQKVVPSLLARFEREMEVMQNPNIPAGVLPHVLHTGEQRMEVETQQGVSSIDVPYYAMEYLDSACDLDDVLKSIGKFPLQAAIDTALLIIMKLHKIALADTAHRDVKLKNILLLPTGEIRIIDPGLAKEEGHEDLTRPFQILGSVRTIAPERLIPDLIGPQYKNSQADIYAGGAVAYELATGREALVAEPMEVVPKHAAGYRPDMGEFQHTSQPSAKALEKIILGMTERTPAERWSYTKSIEELFAISSFRARFKTLEAFEQEESAHRINLPKELLPTDKPAQRENPYQPVNTPGDYGRGMFKVYGVETLEGNGASQSRSRAGWVAAGVTGVVLAAGAAYYAITREKPAVDRVPPPASSAPENPVVVTPQEILPRGATLYPQGDTFKTDVVEYKGQIYNTITFGNDTAYFGSDDREELMGVAFREEKEEKLFAEINHLQSTTFTGDGGAVLRQDLSALEILKLEKDMGIDPEKLGTFIPGLGPKFVGVQLGKMPVFFMNGRWYAAVDSEAEQTFVFTSSQDFVAYLREKGLTNTFKELAYESAMVNAQGVQPDDAYGRATLEPEFFGASQMHILQKELDVIRQELDAE